MALAATLLLLVLPQGADNPFVIGRSGVPEQVRVSADHKAINCLDALYQLGSALGWNVNVDSKPLAGQLALEAVDLYFDAQEPRMVGQLIAMAGGADIVYDEGLTVGAGRPTLHVVHRPDAETEAGRQRLRGLASQWYRSFLVDELRYDPLVEDEAIQVRMHLGHLLIDNGDLESAVRFFREIYEGRPHDFVPMAVLRMAECFLDLKQFDEAEKWARELLESHPEQSQAAQATVVLGRALLGQGRFDECRRELSARVFRLLDSPAMVDVYLIVGESERRLGWQRRAYETMQTLRQSREFDDMTDAQFLDYHFLLGFGATGVDDPELAVQALEWFLIRAKDDSRRGVAYLMLGEAYLAQQSFLQARAAAIEVRDHHMPTLDEVERRSALKLYARSALALGDRETAFSEMERLVRREADPLLALFLVDELIADKQWQRAISVASVPAARDDHTGDEARYKTVVALYQQADAAANMDGFPAQAIELALHIEDPDLRSLCSELIGEAYTALRQYEHAADAFRGILR